jgi:hypothetical protein
VRREIEAGLKMGQHVIPVLVDGTPLPRRDELPGRLAELAGRQACDLARGSRFKADCTALLDAIEKDAGVRAAVTGGE